jgi:hypothetical protein
VDESLRRLDLAAPIARGFDALEIPLCSPPTVDRSEPDRQRIVITLNAGLTITWHTRAYPAHDDRTFLHTTTRLEATNPDAYDRLATGFGMINALLGHLTHRLHTTLKQYAERDTSHRQPGSTFYPRVIPAHRLEGRPSQASPDARGPRRSGGRGGSTRRLLHRRASGVETAGQSR